MRIADVIGDSIVDGPGLRVTIFTQGCPHACPGCHNPETHDASGGRVRSYEELCALLEQSKLTDGLTLTGGEPFLQAEDCAKLAKAARALGLNVWVFTGYCYEYLLEQDRPDWNALLKETDVLVDGRYRAEQRDLQLRFRGSRNQRLIDLNKSRATGCVQLWSEERALLPQFAVPES